MSDLEGVERNARALFGAVIELAIISLVLLVAGLCGWMMCGGTPVEKPLHQCTKTPRAHQLFLLRPDGSRYLVGTMPLKITEFGLATDERLITGECE